MENKKITRNSIEKSQEELRKKYTSINIHGVLESELAHPAEPDLVTMLKQSPLRQSVYYDRRKGPAHAAMRRDSVYVQPVELPDHVISNVIEIEGRRWEYKISLDSPSRFRRVFIERNQLIELDIERSLSWLSASLGSPKHEEIKSQLEQEADINNTNNQIILQLMYNRAEQGLPILENSKCIIKLNKDIQY